MLTDSITVVLKFILFISLYFIVIGCNLLT